MPRAVATLPADAREAFKEPFGPIFEDAERLLAESGSPVIAVGDVVTHHLVTADTPPCVAVVDGKTERTAVSPEVAAGIPSAEHELAVESEPATVSAELLSALVEAIQTDGRTLIRVTGEEDLATIPAVLAAPVGASVVYGQPGEGMVLVNITAEHKAQMKERCELLETTEEFWSVLE